MTKDNKVNILIIKTHAIGDVLWITPSIRKIKEIFPQSKISFLVGNWSKDVLIGNPFIDEIISFDERILLEKKIFRFLNLIRQMRKRRFDRCIIFHSHPFMHFLGFLTGAPARIGFADPKRRSLFLTDPVPQQTGFKKRAGGRYMPDVYMDVVCFQRHNQKEKYPLEMYLYPEEKESAEAIMSKAGIHKPFVAVAPGGGVNPRQTVLGKRWPPEYFASIADYLVNKHETTVVLVGGKSDMDVAEKVIENSKYKIHNLCGKTSIREAASIIDKSILLICNDSSLLHIAVALGIPSITMFGPTGPSSCIPPNDSMHIYNCSILECSPCYIGMDFSCKDVRCMHYISVEDVKSSIDKQMSRWTTSVTFGEK